MSQETVPARRNWMILEVLIAVIAITVAIVTFRYESENNRLQSESMIHTERIRLLQDQLREYEFRLTTAPTYDQGYKDALVKSQVGTFEDGYVAATKVLKTGSYADGYHNAIEQFGTGWLADKERETILKNVSNTETKNEQSPKEGSPQQN